MSATGEALKAELAQRWFAARPGVRLANAYGLTETSDDINHEVMDRGAGAGRVPLGPAIRNVAVYVVDDRPAARSRSAHPGRSSSPVSASAAGTSTTPSGPRRRSPPTRIGRASASTAAATTAAGSPAARWSSSAAATRR